MIYSLPGHDPGGRNPGEMSLAIFFFFNELSQWLLTGKKLSIYRDLRARETKIGL